MWRIAVPPPHQHLEKSAEPWAFHIESILNCKKLVLEKPLKIGNFKSFAAQTKCLGANAGPRTVQGSKVSLLAAYRATCTLPCTPPTEVHTAYRANIGHSISVFCSVGMETQTVSRSQSSWSVSEIKNIPLFQVSRFRVHLLSSFVYWHCPATPSCGFYSEYPSQCWYFIKFQQVSHGVISTVINTILIQRTSSTAQGGGGSFKNRKRIGEIDCCEWRMTNWLTS